MFDNYGLCGFHYNLVTGFQWMFLFSVYQILSVFPTTYMWAMYLPTLSWQGSFGFLTATLEFALLDIIISIHACTFLYLFESVTRWNGVSLSCSSPSHIHPSYLYLPFVFVLVHLICICRLHLYLYLFAAVSRWTEATLTCASLSLSPKNSCFPPSALVSNTISLQTKSKYNYKHKYVLTQIQIWSNNPT